MKKITQSIIIILLLGFTCFGQNQINSTWNQKFNAQIVWQKIYPSGVYLLGTATGFMAVDPDSGKILWKNESYGFIDDVTIDQLGASSLLTFVKDGKTYMLDPYTGQQKFNSDAVGIASINDLYVLYQSNIILVSGKNRENKDMMIATSLSTGKPLWNIQEDYGRLISAEEFSGSELLLVTLYDVFKVNSTTGELIWKESTLDDDQKKSLEKLGAFGDLMKNMASSVAQNMEFDVSFYNLPERKTFYIAAEREQQSAMSSGFTTSTSTTTQPAKETVLIAFNSENGKKLWKSPISQNGTTGPVYFDERGIVLFTNQGSTPRYNLYNYDSGEGVWGKKGKGLKVKGLNNVMNYTVIDGGLLLESYEEGTSLSRREKVEFTHLNLADGSTMFKKPLKTSGEVIFTENTELGILFVTSDRLNIVNISTGETFFDKDIKVGSDLVANTTASLYFYDEKEGAIKALDKKDGNVTTIVNGIQFEGKEVPAKLEIIQEGFLLTSSQNYALFTKEGARVYQHYFEAPKQSALVNILLAAQGVRAAYYATAASVYSAGFDKLSSDLKNEGEHQASSVSSQISGEFSKMASATAGFAAESFAQMKSRLKQTQETDDYAIVLMVQDKNNFLVKLDKATGELLGKIDIGKEKEPSYVVDAVTGDVFYKLQDNEIKGYTF